MKFGVIFHDGAEGVHGAGSGVERGLFCCRCVLLTVLVCDLQVGGGSDRGDPQVQGTGFRCGLSTGSLHRECCSTGREGRTVPEH